MENEKEIATFWDEFAEEYETIQKESVVPLADTVKAYLLKDKILPTASFLDLAGGTGKFIPAFENIVEAYTLVDISKEMLAIAEKKVEKKSTRLLQKSQEDYFKTAKAKRFDVVFSAMNPALETETDLLNFLNLGKIRLILRLVEDSDTLFSPYEPSFQDGLMGSYKEILSAHKIPFKNQSFTFFVEEEISVSFFQTYFKGILANKDLNLLSEKLFQGKENTTNNRKITYELLQF